MSLDVHLEEPKCKHCGRSGDGYSSNITHNLGKMAAEAGIYEIVWRPDECGVVKANQLIKPLRKAISEMEGNPERYDKLF